MRHVFYVVAFIYIIGGCIFLADWMLGVGQNSGDSEFVGERESGNTGIWPLPAEVSRGLQRITEATAEKTSPKAVQSNGAALHAGETLIQWPQPPKTMPSTVAAVHAGETLIERLQAPKAVRSNLAAVHAGEMLIEWPQAPKVVRSNLAAVHAGETLIEWPQAPKVVRSNLAAVHAGETLVKPAMSPPIPQRKPASPAAMANASTGAVPRPTETKVVKTAPPKAAGPATNRSKLRPAEKSVVEKPRRTDTARAEAAPSAPEVRRPRRMATAEPPAVKMQSRRQRAAGGGNEVKRAIGELDDDDRRAFRSRCGQILSAPGRFARSHVEICMAASL